MVTTWTKGDDGRVEIYFEDGTHGGGVRMSWDNGAWARSWLDELSQRLDDLYGDDE